MFKGVEPILIIKQKTIVLPRAKPIVIKGILMAFRVRYSESKHN
jgi:hypothetical protein